VVRLRADGCGLALPFTSLVEVPTFARMAGVGRVLIKMESERWLGSFKSLGGAFAALCLVAEEAGFSAQDVLSRRRLPIRPRLLCASAGNHGLAVAAMGRILGADTTIYLRRGVNPTRAQRILDAGAKIEWVEGIFDDAAAAAVCSAISGGGILVPDTSDEPDSRAVSWVMEGYSVISIELLEQFAERDLFPSHVIVQAGVGGLAAALALGMRHAHRPPKLIVVEPVSAACVGQALGCARIKPMPGNLSTSAEMLACGLASAPAVKALKSYGALAMTVSEDYLACATDYVRTNLQFATTPSGAAGIAGLMAAAADPTLRKSFALDEESVVCLVLSEGDLHV
jgi:diaminopropionate ammonia-lyase